MTFDKYQHFGETTDFTSVIQTFKEGSTFGDGTKFKSDGTQSLPTGTIPAFGVLLESVTCIAEDCKPADDSKFLEPGEILPPGTDPAPSYTSVSSDDKSLAVDGLGLSMSFETVSSDGTIKKDLLDPEDVTSATTESDGSITVTTSGGSVPVVGSVIDLSAGTATVSGTITVTLPYVESNIPAGKTESDLTLVHQVNGEWIEETNCTTNTTANTVTCNVTSLSPFGVGTKSSSSSSSTSGSISSNSGGTACYPDALDGKSLRLYEIRYNLCGEPIIEVIGYSACGIMEYTVRDNTETNHGRLNPEQNYLDQIRVSMIASVSADSDTFKILVKNLRENISHSLNPEIVDGKFLECTGNVILPQFSSKFTGYTSDEEASQWVAPEEFTGYTSDEQIFETPEPEPIEPEYTPEPEPIEPEYTPEPEEIDEGIFEWLLKRLLFSLGNR